jgi:hypothetical protein
MAFVRFTEFGKRSRAPAYFDISHLLIYSCLSSHLEFLSRFKEPPGVHAMAFSSGYMRLAIFTAVCVVASACALSDQPARVVVVSVTGDWKHDETRVTFGQSLPATGCLFASDGAVVLQSDKETAPAQPFVCEKPSRDASCAGHPADRCAIPLDPTKWKSNGSGLGNLWVAVRKLFTGDPEKYIVAASRGLEPGLVDTVVPLEDHKIDLAAAFSEMSGGKYWVSLTPLNGSASAAATGPFEVQYSAHHSALVSAPAIQPGLYRLVLTDQAGAPGGSDSWILVSAPRNFSSASPAFRAAVEKSSGWPPDMDPSAVRALLRAYLESLQISGAQGKP